MKRRVFAGLLLALSCACGQDVFDEIVRRHGGRFMGAVLVARGGEVLFSRGYGHANLEWDIANTPESKFRLGSVTKQFTAASILLLEERGKLSIADPVNKYLADGPAAWKDVTLHHLLTHTSGIPSFTGFPEYPGIKKRTHTPEQLVALFRGRPLEFAPGDKYRYNNSGYVLLGYLVEKVSGVSYERFVRENLFEPLDMKDSGYDLAATIIPRRASGYTLRPSGMVNADYTDMTVPHGAGALYSTTSDLLRWAEGLFGGKVLRPASLAKMTTPFRNKYACGLLVSERAGHKVIEHGGGIEGFNTMLAWYPEDKLAVVVLGNLNGTAPGKIAAAVAEAALNR